MSKLITCLWFNGNAEEAVRFYQSIFKNSKVTHTARYSAEVAKQAGMPEGSVLTIAFELEGCPFLALNGGPHFQFSPATSHIINCDTQEEIDHFWDKLSEGGKPSQCGWLDDKFGVTWQVVPTEIAKFMQSDDPARSARVMAAMFPMKKLDLKTLRDAYEQG
jgi:predicted 3-demethylubiquinone-9 3-methyltransferase (glyoxalase superfamily)